MKRLLGQVLFVATCGVLASALTPGCADNDQSIFVRMVMAPPQNRQNGQCVYTNDPTQPRRSQGSLDVGLSSTYESMLLVGSQLVARGQTNTTRAEPNHVHLNGAVVRVTDANGKQISEFTALGAGDVDPGANNSPAYGLIQLPIIDAQTSAKIQGGLTQGGPAKLVVANVKVFGKTLGGVDLETGEFAFPIQVCLGCLIDFPAAADDPAKPGADCLLPATGTTSGTNTQAPCNLGQDEVVSCLYCRDHFPICRTPPPSP
jgi:hypothetical protein